MGDSLQLQDHHLVHARRPVPARIVHVIQESKPYVTMEVTPHFLFPYFTRRIARDQNLVQLDIQLYHLVLTTREHSHPPT